MRKMINRENDIEGFEVLITSKDAIKLKKLVTKGTKEWADSNINIYSGCSNNCRYCYAKKMAIRFHRKTPDNWKYMEPNLKAIIKGYGKRKGRIMFPSSHDITPAFLDECIFVLTKILRAGNQVLITSKPNFDCIQEICDSLSNYKDQIQFRFTITSINDYHLDFWERDAPVFHDRLFSLIFAFDKGFKTSASIEPFLDKDPGPLIHKIYDYISESIWIGPMNHIWKKDFKSPNELDELARIKQIHQRENLLKIYNTWECVEKIRFKDAFMNKIK